MRQASVLSFQVSLPGSPGAGTMNVFHCVSPVLGSSPASQSRTPLSPPEAPMTMECSSASGAAVSSRSGWSPSFLSQTIWPLSLSVAMTLASRPATEMTRLPHSATPRLRSGFCWPGSIFQRMRPAVPERTSILYTTPQTSVTYIMPSSTSGVASTYSLAEWPPSGIAKASLRFLTFDLLIAVSGEKRCEPKS